MRFFVTERVGKRRRKTPEGFLVIEGVPLARTGMYDYHRDELDFAKGEDAPEIKTGADGMVKVLRTEAEVFRTETVASANGKSVTDDHPPEDVDPDNWAQLTLGFVLNPRRGTGDEADLLLGDVMITRGDGISRVEAEDSVELSCGYDARYFLTDDGRLEQRDIIINHVALVDRGRCGPRCAIGDSDMTVKKPTWKDRLLKALKAKDDAGVAAALGEAPEAETMDDDGGAEAGGTHFHVHMPIGTTKGGMTDDDEGASGAAGNSGDPAAAGAIHPAVMKFMQDTAAQMSAFNDALKKLAGAEGEMQPGPDGEEVENGTSDAAIEGALKEEAPAGTELAAAKAKDSRYLEDSFQETVSLAELLVPGIGIPTFDRAAGPKKTYDSICALRRKALTLAWNDTKGRAHVEAVIGEGRELDVKKLTCGRVRDLFRSSAALARAANTGANGGTGRVAHDVGGYVPVAGAVRSIADVNRINREFHEGKRS